MKSKETKRSLFLSVISLLLCFAILAGNTFAWFTAVVKTEKNEIVVGNLDVEMEYSLDFEDWKTVDTTTKLFNEDALWQPGYSEVVYLKVKNAGDLSLRYQLSIKINEEQVAINKNDKIFKLSDYIQVGAVKDIEAGYSSNTDAILAAKNDAIVMSTFSKNGVIEAGGADQYFALVVYMPESVGNVANYRGEAPTINFGISLYATQIEGDFSDITNESQFVSITGSFTDTKIVDETTAIQAVQESSNLLRLENATDELTVANVSTVDGSTYYKLQQNYNGIPVYGRNIVVIVDEDGEAQGVTSNAVDVPENLLLIPSVTQEQIEQKTLMYLGNGHFDLEIPTADTSNLIIYNYDNPILAYELYVIIDQEPYKLIINAIDGNVLNLISLLYDNSEYVQDQDKRIYVFDGENKELSFEYDYSLANVSNPTAVLLMDLVSNTYNFYFELFGRTGFNDCNGDVFVVSDCLFKDGNGNLYGENAFSHTSTDCKSTLLAFGNDIQITADVVAHEYMHSVEATISNMDYQMESGAIMEGYSDIFGELFEDWYSDKVLNGSNDWKDEFRNIANPLEKQNPVAYQGKYWGDILNTYDHGYVHNNSTVISHAAYLMSNGVNNEYAPLNADTLAMLWYRTLFTLPSNCTFDILCKHMEITANLMGLTYENRKCISEAFNAVGINSSFIDSAEEGGNSAGRLQPPILSEEKAAVFIGFITNNPTLTKAIAEKQEWYQIMTNTYEGDDFAEKAKAFTTTVLSTISSQATAAIDNSEYLRQDLLAFFEDEAYYLNIDSFKDGLKAGYDLLGIITENIDPIIDPFKLPSQINDTINNLTLFIKASKWALECEKAGRYTYFCQYINNRNSFRTYYSVNDMDSADLSHFNLLMAGCQFDATEKKQFAAFLDCFTWITNKNSFLNHFDLLNEWAEYIFQLNYYLNNYVEDTSSPEEDNTPSDGLIYTLNSNKTSYSVSGIGTCDDAAIIVPDKYNDLPVTAIGKAAFANCKTIQSIVIPKGVTAIGEIAFYRSTLIDITLPDTITLIDDKAFYEAEDFQNIYFVGDESKWCQIQIIGNSQYPIRDATKYFNGIMPTKYDIPDGVTSIGDWIFAGFSTLEEISIPDSVTSIGERAFKNCEKLNNVMLPSGIGTIGKRAFWGCTSLESITIPENVTIIDAYVFTNCKKLSEVILHNNVTSIKENAFSHTGLITIDVPDSVVNIGEWAFYGCEKLTNISVGKVTTINKYTFSQCNTLTEIEFPDGIISLGNACVTSPKLVKVKIPKSLKQIDGYAFHTYNHLVIEYAGTVEEWNSINKAYNWDRDLQSNKGYTVYCSDGIA